MIRYYSLILYSKFILIHYILEKTLNSVYREGPSLYARILNENGLFFRPQLSLESKTITNQEQIGCLV